MNIYQCNRWDVVTLQQWFSQCYLDFMFFYDEKYHLEDVHLLEHMLLHHRRELRKYNMTLGDLIEEYTGVNWLTWWAFMVLRVWGKPEDIQDLARIMTDIIDEEPDLPEEAIRNEANIMDIEDKYFRHKVLDSYEMLSNITPAVPSQSTISKKLISNLYNNIVKNNRVHVTIMGNIDNEPIKETIEYIKDRASQWSAIPKKEVFTNIPYTYNKHQATFNRAGKPHYVWLLLLSRDIEQFTVYEISLCFTIISEAIREVTRFDESTDYELEQANKITPYGRTGIYKFHTHLWYEDLQKMVQKIFHIDEDTYELRRKRAYKIYYNFLDDDYQFYYHYWSLYFVNKSYTPLYEWVENMFNTSYERFCYIYEVLTKDIVIKKYE